MSSAQENTLCEYHGLTVLISNGRIKKRGKKEANTEEKKKRTRETKNTIEEEKKPENS